jgi:16S rRNA (guanine527-N7)-methyltransferase
MSRDDNRTAALKLVPVSRETLERLDAYVALLGQWRKAVNLISESTFAEVWTRHVADSAQLLAFAPQAKIWVDMGSGAGFPGLVIAIQLANQPGALVHLIESDKRKCAFLREAARVAGAPAIIHNERIETAAQRITDAVDAVSARALAPLPKLIDFAKIWLEHGAIGVFPRGRTDEPVVRSDFRNYTIEFPRSRTDTMSSISIIRKQPPEKTVAATSPDGLAEP